MLDFSQYWKKYHVILISAGVLAISAFFGALLVGLGHQGTLERIAHNEREALIQQLKQIIPQELYDNDLLTDTLQVQSPEYLGSPETTLYRAHSNGKCIAIIFSPVVTNGYNGKIHLLIGVYTNGKIAGVRVLKHRETPGLGDKIEIERTQWITGFDNKSLQQPTTNNWLVERDGGAFDQFTGATITPRAIVAAVKKTLQYFSLHQHSLINDDATQTAHKENN